MAFESTYIKPGYWLTTRKPYGKGFLNLTQMITSAIPELETLDVLSYPVENSYPTVNDMTADQGSQTVKFFQYVIDTDTYYEYLGTTNASIGDYRELTPDEVTVINGKLKAPVDGIYANAAAMYADQKKQISGFIYRTSDDDAHFEYVGTRNGNASDYKPVGSGSGGSFVPYTGAITGVDLNAQTLSNVASYNGLPLSYNNSTFNTLIGEFGGTSINNVFSSTIIGRYAAEQAKNAQNSVFIGATAGRNSIGSDNVCIGSGTGFFNTGNNNVFIGKYAGYNAQTIKSIIISNNVGASDVVWDTGTLFGTSAAATDFDDTTNQITITGHGIPVGGRQLLTYDNFGIVGGGVPSYTQGVFVEYVDADTVLLLNGTLSGIPNYDINWRPAFKYTNSIFISSEETDNITASNQIKLGSTQTEFIVNNYNFNVGQTLGATEDNYVLTYDDASSTISFEPSSAANLQAVTDVGNTTTNAMIIENDAATYLELYGSTNGKGVYIGTDASFGLYDADGSLDMGTGFFNWNVTNANDNMFTITAGNISGSITIGLDTTIGTAPANDDLFIYNSGINFTAGLTQIFLQGTEDASPNGQFFATLPAGTGTLVYTVNSQFAPSDGANAGDITLNAVHIPITDSGTYFTATDVEGALQEIKVLGTGSTVAGLPVTPVTGMRSYVTDSTVAASGNFGATVVGGGANTVPVFYDGSNWIIA